MCFRWMLDRRGLDDAVGVAGEDVLALFVFSSSLVSVNTPESWFGVVSTTVSQFAFGRVGEDRSSSMAHAEAD